MERYGYRKGERERERERKGEGAKEGETERERDDKSVTWKVKTEDNVWNTEVT